MDNQEKFEKFDKACKSVSLSDKDIAILLQVTPAMVSRYRKGSAANIGARGDKDKLQRAAKALKVLRGQGAKVIRAMTPLERAQGCIAALKEVAPELKLNSVIV